LLSKAAAARQPLSFLLRDFPRSLKNRYVIPLHQRESELKEF